VRIWRTAKFKPCSKSTKVSTPPDFFRQFVAGHDLAGAADQKGEQFRGLRRGSLRGMPFWRNSPERRFSSKFSNRASTTELGWLAKLHLWRGSQELYPHSRNRLSDLSLAGSAESQANLSVRKLTGRPPGRINLASGIGSAPRGLKRHESRRRLCNSRAPTNRFQFGSRVAFGRGCDRPIEALHNRWVE